ncbi:MAG: thrombospondin type 3 repeat-containing protein [Proteobacteria bacterium]|nr:thrombospondin type 3 repeat-containing protein [Pseudomonadota bacterium]
MMRNFFVALAFSVFFLVITTAAMGGVPTISNLSDKSIQEGAPAAVYDSDIQFSGGEDYADGYLRYSIASATTDDVFSLSSDADPNVLGAVSLSAGFVYLGNGSGRDLIGIIDATENGQNGLALKILFYRSLENGGFETGDAGDGWTQHQSRYLPDLDGNPINYSFSDGETLGSGTIRYNGVYTWPVAPTYVIQIETDTENVSSGSYSLRLTNSGVLGFPQTNQIQPDGNGSFHGPYVESSSFTAYADERVYFDWSAQNGYDAYEVICYLINQDNGSRTELFARRGDTQGWTTTQATIPSDGNYRFEFVCGSYDWTGNRYVGASLYLDNIRIVTGLTIDDTTLSTIARHVTYVNSGVFGSDVTRTVSVGVGTNDKNTGAASADLTITMVVDSIPTVSQNNGISLAEGSTGSIGISALRATDSDTDDASLIYSLTSNPAYGRVEDSGNPGTAITSFIQQDLTDGSIRYVHNGSNTTSDSFVFSVSNGTNTLTGQTFSITITTSNDMPVLSVNTGLTVVEGLMATLGSAMLQATDEESDDATLVFNLTTSPVNGYIENTDNPGSAITSFTQQDLIDNKIRYVHNGSNTLSDLVTFSVFDGANTLSGQDFLISVTNVDDDAPTMATNSGLTLNEGATAVIPLSVLRATDTESDDASLIFTVTTASVNGQLEKSGNPVLVFTQQDLIDNMISYVHNGSNTTSDTFTFRVSDGTNILSGQVFSVTINAVDDEVPFVSLNTGMTVAENETKVIGVANLNASDADTDDSILLFQIVSGPSNGQIERSGETGTAITSFSQADLAAGLIVYAHDGSATLTDTFGFTVSDGTNLLTGQSFAITITEAYPPQVTTSLVSAISATGANSGGTILSDGGNPVTARGICWGLSSGPSIGGNHTTDGVGTGSFTSQISGMTPGTIYYVRAYATNLEGTAYGNEVSFITLSSAPVASAATDISATGFTSHWNAVLGAIGYSLDISVSSGFDSFLVGYQSRPDSGLDESVSGLVPGQVYHYRVRSENISGTSANSNVIELRLDGNSWIGGSGDWNDPSNWSAGAVPGPEDDVYIGLNTDLGDIIILVNVTVDIKSISMSPAFEGEILIDSGYSLTTEYYLQEGGTVDCGQGPMDINGDFVLSGGLFIAPSGSMTLEGDFSHAGGTFEHNNGTLILDGMDQALTGSTIFNNFVKEVAQADTLTFESGTMTTFEGAVQFHGGSSDEPLILDCTDSGTSIDIIIEYDFETRDTIMGSCIQLINEIGMDEPRATLFNTPPTLTNASSYAMGVGGIGVTHYIYMLDGGAWSGEYSVDQPLGFIRNTEGVHTLSVLGKDIAGSWQAQEQATTFTWTIDTTPPVAVIDNCPEGIVGRGDLEVMVRGLGEDISAYRYKIDQGLWSESVPSLRPIILTDLGEGEHTLEVTARDRAGNWQAPETSSQKTWTVDVEALSVTLVGVPGTMTSDDHAIITVTGDQVVAYMYRFDEGTWTYGVVEDDILLTDLSDGLHTLSVRGLSVYGDVGDTGDGAVIRYWTVDTTASQAPVLTVSPGAPSSTSIDLSWTWSSANGQEVISRYRLWMSLDVITEDTLSRATEIWCGIVPGPEGYVEMFTMSGLLPGTSYHFAVKTVDRAGHVSDLSNDAVLTTQDLLPEITDLVLTEGGTQADNSLAREIRLMGSNFVRSPGNNIIRFENGPVVFDIINSTGNTTQMTAFVPIGAPEGTYDVRIINKNGVSLKFERAYTVTKAGAPVPVVINVSPLTLATGTTATLTITGQNFTEPVTAIRLVRDSDTVIPAHEIVFTNSTTLMATLDVPSDAVEGIYSVFVEHGNGMINGVSAVRVRVFTPVDLETSQGPVNTNGMITVIDGTVPVDVELSTDDRDEVDAVSSYPIAVTLTIRAGSEFEALSGDVWEEFTGMINAPVQVPLSPEVISYLGNDASQITMGADKLLRLGNGETMRIIVEVTVSSGAPVPQLYHMADDGTLSLAGIEGSEGGIDYVPGGTIVSVRENVPENGMVTYTLSALLNELDNEYAVGSMVPNFIDSKYGPCFIGSSLYDKLAWSWGWFVLIPLGCLVFFFGKPSWPFMGTALSLIVTLAAGTAIAGDSRDETWYILAGGGFQMIGEKYNAIYLNVDQALKVDNDLYPFLKAGYNISDRIALEAGFRYDMLSGSMEASQDGGSDSVSGYTLLFGPVYRFQEMNTTFMDKWQPFLKADVGYRKLNSGLAYAVKNYDPAIGFELAVGVEKGPVDARIGYAFYTHKQNESAVGYNPAGSSSDLGLSGVFFEVAYRFSFGKDKGASLPARHSEKTKKADSGKDKNGVPVKGNTGDSDNDGIPDSRDKCPHTPGGVMVDSWGCSSDDDNDGVINEQDKCAFTPPGISVDSNGCPADSDGDGVSDDRDTCAGTPPWTPVDEKGCPVDSDKDGVEDAQDWCPGTPQGETVNAYGCPEGMTGLEDVDSPEITDTPMETFPIDETTDSDHDGVPDYLDQCPGTPKGAVIDDRGCWLVD